ncbi:MAG: hypothetical protein II180_14840 [Proteobacteria bacterium]|nr:hypothetical protein [Pseudomonadota bacterium]
MKKQPTRYCRNCPQKKLDKDTVALNLKLLGREIRDFYCLECMAETLEVTVQDLLDKIESYKEGDCELFK